jgi:hypothetical protein
VFMMKSEGAEGFGEPIVLLIIGPAEMWRVLFLMFEILDLSPRYQRRRR